MSKSAEGIVEKAATFTGRVRDFVYIILMNNADEPLSNTKCKVTFQDGQTMLVESDDKGVIRFPRKAEGQVEIELLEEESIPES